MSKYRSMLWNNPITVYHKSESTSNGKKVITWTRIVYSDCFWKLENQQNIKDLSLVKNPRYIVRIPFDKNKEVFINIGDIVVKGEVDDELITGTSTKLMNKYSDNCFMVNSITDNTKMQYTAHWLLSDVK